MMPITPTEAAVVPARRDGNGRATVYVSSASGFLYRVVPSEAPGEAARVLEAVAPDDGDLGVWLEEMKTEFVANVSHELKTPLTSIKAYTEALTGMVSALRREAGGIDGIGEALDRHLDFLRVVEDDSNRLELLINDLLCSARIHAGMPDLALESVHPHDLLAYLVSLPRFSGSRPQVVADLSGECGPARMDRVQMTDALVRLVTNAVQHSPKDTLVRVRANEAEGELRIAVSDEGEGIAEHLHRRIFEPFFRVDASLTSPVAGLGLGLTIALAIVEAHGGRIEVRSAPGRGSVLTACLPAS